jgi:hypothetical protein
MKAASCSCTSIVTMTNLHAQSATSTLLVRRGPALVCTAFATKAPKDAENVVSTICEMRRLVATSVLTSVTIGAVITLTSQTMTVDAMA